MTEGKIRVGFIVGNDADRVIQFNQDAFVPVQGNNDADRVLDLCGGGRFDWTRLHIAPSYFRKARRWDTSKIDVLWNMVSDHDQNPETLKVIDRFTSEVGIPLINPAQAVRQTRRHLIPGRLASLEGVRTPQTLLLRNPTLDRVRRQTEETGFQFPAILRRTGSHNGEVVGVFETAAAIEGVYGDRRHEYYLTEFVDVRRLDGLYRKSRFFFIGEDIVVRQHIIADTWKIHGSSSRSYMAKAPHLQEEARAMLTGGFEALPTVTRAALQAIRTRIGLEYSGLDAYIDPDGGVLVFEANATMNFQPDFRNPMTQYNRASVAPAVSAVSKLLYAKLGSRATKT